MLPGEEYAALKAKHSSTLPSVSKSLPKGVSNSTTKVRHPTPQSLNMQQLRSKWSDDTIDLKAKKRSSSRSSRPTSSTASSHRTGRSQTPSSSHGRSFSPRLSLARLSPRLSRWFDKILPSSPTNATTSRPGSSSSKFSAHSPSRTGGSRRRHDPAEREHRRKERQKTAAASHERWGKALKGHEAKNGTKYSSAVSPVGVAYPRGISKEEYDRRVRDMRLVPLGEITANLHQGSTLRRSPGPKPQPKERPLTPETSPGYAKPRRQKESGTVDLSNFDFVDWNADTAADGDDPQMFATARPEKTQKHTDCKKIKRKPVPGMVPEPLNVQKATNSGLPAKKTGNISSRRI